MEKKQFIMLADLDRCIGCRGGCQVACKMEHGIALGPSRSKLYTMGPTGEYPDVEMYFIPVMCQQCEDPACVRVCPTGACYKDEADGVVYVDRDICIGCQTCIRSCPYQANFYNKELRVADKCDGCRARRDRGEVPACVRNCSGAALHFGDINDPESEVSRLTAEAGPGNVYSLQNRDDCNPSGKFILKNDKWLDVLPQEFQRNPGRTGNE
jgi:Fe-S-cluster-containing dehydrogenase component